MGLIGTMIETHMGGRKSSENIRKLQGKKLKKLVNYARKNSPYFKELYKNVGDDFKLEDLPPTNKVAMMANFDAYITDRSITMDRIEDYTKDIENVGRMIDDKYLIFKTSGSTGNPATILYDKKNIDVSSAVAALRTFARKEDFKKFLKSGKKTAGVFANYGFYLACGMSRYLQLKMPKKKNKITVDVNAKEDKIIKELNDFKPSMLSGYPSNLALLADCKELSISPDVVITGGELLTDEIRKKLSDRFSCYVQTHYSCTEAGEIACECSVGHLHINEDWVIVEPVDKDNNPVGFGVRSDKVLITNLSNYIQPFIRYELTDRIIVHNGKCKCGKSSCFLEIEGRTDDILEFENGVSIAPMSFYNILEEIPEIKRFQLIQRSKNKLELRLLTDERDVAFRKATKDLQEFLHSKEIYTVEVSLSEEAPKANKVSGKFKHIFKDFE
ncbi:MAG: phenylacetate--CoA ligase family protein [Lachnospiraceae bacterium]|nr:phenylacetate--CoA ligase family protein [Lachnospiraceae bacterium]